MNFTIEMALLAASLIGAFGAQTIVTRRREKSLVAKIDALGARLDRTERETDRQRGVMGKLFAQREKDIETKIRQNHSDLKRVEMQMRNPDRETPESVELAIQLARAGEGRDQIVRKTGLSADIIETISALHAARPRH